MTDTLSNAYGDEGSNRRDEKLARDFERSQTYDDYLAMRDSDPERYARLPQQIKGACGHYAEQRAAAERVGRA